MENGTINKLMKERGFGFIKTGDGKEVFFHRSECHQMDFDALEPGQEVGFDLEITPKGPRAKNLRPRTSD